MGMIMDLTESGGRITRLHYGVRGGFVIDIEWKPGKLTEAVIHSTLDTNCKVRYGKETTQFITTKGGIYKLDAELKLKF